MNINPSTLISMGALLSHGALAVVILRQKIYNRVRVFFLLYLLSIMIWSFAAFMIFSEIKVVNTLFWNRVLVVGSLAAPVAFFGFVVAFVGEKRKIWLWLGLLGYLGVQICNGAGWVVVNAATRDGILTNEYGPALGYTSILWAVYFGFAAYELVRAYRNSKDNLYRNRLLYLLLVVLVIFIGNLTNLTDLKSVPTDVSANIISAFLITLAILRHRMLDITLVVRKGILYSVPTVLIGATYYLIIQSMLQALPEMDSLGLFLISIMAAILVTLFIQPVLGRIQSWIDRLFFREQYDAARMLERISRATAHVLDLETITQLILQEVSETLHVARGAVWIKRRDSGEYVLTAVKGPGKMGNTRWANDHPLVRVMERQGEPVTRQQLSVLLQSAIPFELDPPGNALFIPLKTKDELVGVFILGVKLSELAYSTDDQLTLTTLANQIAMVMENARLFSAEQSRREELDTLYELTRKLAAANTVVDVLHDAAQQMVLHTRVTFARILTSDPQGKFYCRAAFPAQFGGQNLCEDGSEPAAALPYYRVAIRQSSPLILQSDDPYLTHGACVGLMLDQVNRLLIFSLQVGKQTLGLLVLGEQLPQDRELFDADKIRLIQALATQIADALQRADMREQMESSFMEIMLTLANAMDARDTYAEDHNHALRDLAEMVCQKVHCNEEEIWAVRWAALLHDIGKIGVPDQILRKNGTLTEEEWAIMKQHPLIGARIVAPVKKLTQVAPLIQAHHERYDGSGYPYGLKGKDIPRGARILAIADSYSAMIDDRAYREARTPQAALQELRRSKGTQFDPELVEIFASLVERGNVSKK
jgi:putative nucleotidyltransferase with HDIG domain